MTACRWYGISLYIEYATFHSLPNLEHVKYLFCTKRPCSKYKLLLSFKFQAILLDRVKYQNYNIPFKVY